MTTTTLAPVMPTSGSARRRAKVEAARQRGYDLETNWAFLNDRIPPSAIAVSVCGCGRVSWLMPGADDETHAGFDRDNDDHGDYCSGSP